MTLHDEVEATSTVRQPREEGQGGRISTRTRRVLGRQVSPQKQKKLRFGCAWHLAELAQSPTDSSSTNEGFPISSVQLSSDQGACSVVPEESGAIRQDYEAQALWSALGMPPCPLGYSQSTRLPSACQPAMSRDKRLKRGMNPERPSHIMPSKDALIRGTWSERALTRKDGGK